MANGRSFHMPNEYSEKADWDCGILCRWRGTRPLGLRCAEETAGGGRGGGGAVSIQYQYETAQNSGQITQIVDTISGETVTRTRRRGGRTTNTTDSGT